MLKKSTLYHEYGPEKETILHAYKRFTQKCFGVKRF